MKIQFLNNVTVDIFRQTLNTQEEKYYRKWSVVEVDRIDKDGDSQQINRGLSNVILPNGDILVDVKNSDYQKSYE